MRKIIDVLRLKFETGLSHERIAAATKLSKGAVTKYVQRARDAGLGWPLPPEVDEARLEALLFPHAAPVVERYAAPDFAHLHQELKRKGVTLQLLWEEYAEAHAGQAYRYSQFCLHYHRFAQSLKRSMRQVHRAGDKLFIDYSGDTVPIINPGTFDHDAGSGPGLAARDGSSIRWPGTRPRQRAPARCAPAAGPRTAARWQRATIARAPRRSARARRRPYGSRPAVPAHQPALGFPALQRPSANSNFPRNVIHRCALRRQQPRHHSILECLSIPRHVLPSFVAPHYRFLSGRQLL